MHKGRLYLLTFLRLFGLLTPLEYRTLGFHDRWITNLFAAPLSDLSKQLFGITSAAPLSSDSITLYLWVGILLVLSMIITLFRFSEKTGKMLLVFMEKLLIYFLILQLMRYGFDKIFKGQFYLPEPNILTTELGQLDKDLLYWSTMGSSHAYNVFLGAIEVLAAGLLIFARTRVLGLVLAAGIFLQILAINISYDISVKLLSAVLLLTTLTCLAPYAQSILRFFLGDPSRPLPKPKIIHLGPIQRPLKMLVLFLIGLESMFTYVASGNYNDDLAERPFLHGMYVNSDPSSKIKRFFVHRDGYLIIENQQGQKSDYALQIDEAKQVLKITDYQFKTTEIPYALDTQQQEMTLQWSPLQSEHFRVIDWQTMPLLLPQMHWTLDAGF